MSVRDSWSTPDALIFAWGPFDLDVCAASHNAKAPRFFTEADDGLVQTWIGKVWCNPPYSNIQPWVDKAVSSDAQTFMLVPDNTSSRWYRDAVEKCDEWFLFRGRVQFVPPEGVQPSSNDRGSTLFVFTPERRKAFSGFLNPKTGELE